ncbi:hypothetical protein BKA62DRAFT_695622 [Auriculariales sp. MPI-PUGE-AT-0066]|nr:hypothetical protein BKA62DRAFT_695622 [Auriculariales sp. MPI-PUGE-AT-0066]
MARLVHLPMELLLYTLGLLPRSHLLRCAEVSRAWRNTTIADCRYYLIAKLDGQPTIPSSHGDGFLAVATHALSRQLRFSIRVNLRRYSAQRELYAHLMLLVAEAICIARELVVHMRLVVPSCVVPQMNGLLSSPGAWPGLRVLELKVFMLHIGESTRLHMLAGCLFRDGAPKLHAVWLDDIWFDAEARNSWKEFHVVRHLRLQFATLPLLDSEFDTGEIFPLTRQLYLDTFSTPLAGQTVQLKLGTRLRSLHLEENTSTVLRGISVESLALIPRIHIVIHRHHLDPSAFGTDASRLVTALPAGPRHAHVSTSVMSTSSLDEWTTWDIVITHTASGSMRKTHGLGLVHNFDRYVVHGRWADGITHLTLPTQVMPLFVNSGAWNELEVLVVTVTNHWLEWEEYSWEGAAPVFVPALSTMRLVSVTDMFSIEAPIIQIMDMTFGNSGQPIRLEVQGCSWPDAIDPRQVGTPIWDFIVWNVDELLKH